MKTTIVAFGHKAQHGKDTAGKYLIEQYRDRYEIGRYAFADVLKQEVNEMFHEIARFGNSTQQECWQMLCDKWGVKCDPNPPMDDPLCPYGKQRPMLQFWGNYMRQEDPFHWVHKVGDRIADDKPEFAVITDMRYWNCADWVKEQGGYRIKVRRLGYYNPKINNTHISEIDLDKYLFDYTITVPDGRVDILEAVTMATFEDILGPC